MQNGFFNSGTTISITYVGCFWWVLYFRLRKIRKRINFNSQRGKAFFVTSEGDKSYVLPEKFWTGIHINRNSEITSLQEKLQNLRNKYTSNKKEFNEKQLHITFAFPAKVDEIEPVKIPYEKFLIDRITIVKKVGEVAPYKIHKHIKFGK